MADQIKLYHISLSTPDFLSLKYGGGKSAWRDKKALLEAYLSDKQPIVAAIFDGTLTETMCKTAADKETYRLANRALAAFLLRIICPEKGAALTKEILSRVRDKLLPNRDGAELTTFLDERAEFASEADQRKALIALKNMQLKSTITREQIEAFGVDLKDMHERCTQADRMKLGSIITLLAAKMPSDIAAEAKQLRTQLGFMNTFHHIQPDF